METKKFALTTPRIAFLLPLAIGITLLLLWVVKDFLLAILIAAVLAGLVHPFYGRVERLLGGRKSLAAGATETYSCTVANVTADFTNTATADSDETGPVSDTADGMSDPDFTVSTDATNGTASIDPDLNDQAYIVPGLGDAGDRYFGT